LNRSVEPTERLPYSAGNPEPDVAKAMGASKSAKNVSVFLTFRIWATWATTSLKSNLGELFFRAYARTGLIRNFFLKGTLAGGGTSNGKLFDEDFPPITESYSKTESPSSGVLRSGTLGLGYNLYTRERFRVGAFVGLNTWLESVGARGCVQLAASPSIWIPTCWAM
jgi:hypothetical protein